MRFIKLDNLKEGIASRQKQNCAKDYNKRKKKGENQAKAKQNETTRANRQTSKPKG